MSRIRDNVRFHAGRFVRLELPVRSAALAYHSILSIIPTFGLAVWYLNRLGVTREWRRHIENFILSHLNIADSDAFVATFRRLTNSVGAKTWGWLPFLLLLYTTFNLVRRSGDSLDLVIDSSVEEPRFRPRYLGLFARRLLVMTLLPLVLSFSLFVSIWLHRESWFRELFAIEGSTTFLSTPAAWVVTIVGVYVFYQFMPARPVPMHVAMRAAFLTGPALEIAKGIMTDFSRKALAVQKLYGALASIPLLILWAQVAWMILLGGAFLLRPKTPNLETKSYL